MIDPPEIDDGPEAADWNALLKEIDRRNKEPLGIPRVRPEKAQEGHVWPFVLVYLAIGAGLAAFMRVDRFPVEPWPLVLWIGVVLGWPFVLMLLVIIEIIKLLLMPL